MIFVFASVYEHNLIQITGIASNWSGQGIGERRQTCIQPYCLSVGAVLRRIPGLRFDDRRVFDASRG